MHVATTGRRTVALVLVAMLAGATPIWAGSASIQISAEGEPAMFKSLFSKQASVPDLAALQSAVVRSVAGDVTDLQEGEWEDRDWVHLAVNHEVLVEDGRNSSSQAVVLARRLGAKLEHLNFRLSPESKVALLALRDTMAAYGQEPWTIVDLTVERDGRYDFAFRYDPPPRLNGDLLHRPLHDLLARYIADKGQQ